MAAPLLLRNCRPLGGAATDILMAATRIAAIGPGLEAPPGAGEEDAAGLLLLPGLVEGHTHLDKTLWGMGWWRSEVGPLLIDRIEGERASRRGGFDAAGQSARLARDFLARGTTRIRSFADVDTEIGTAHADALVALRETLRGTLDIQVVAFPQSGLLVRPGTLALLEQALRNGADIVGGLDPSGIDRDPKGHLDAVFGLSEKHGKPLDIHLHEPGELGAFALELTVERTKALGMQGRVVVSHGFCLGEVARAPALYAALAEAGIAVATTAPPSRPVPSVRAMRAAGGRIFGGNDGIRDTWTPYNTPDMLQRAMLIGLKNEFRRDDEIAWALDCVTGWAAAACGFSGHGLAVGDRADLVLVAAETVAEAVVAQPPRRLVVSHGRVVARDGALLG
ncbi:amidohydrolase family protein [Falsiroseomonas selenitidurans]|uniref:Amidohydrolase family protein n=1 Tax=Falsiroseomonas selenitidurans TaxID=2716335 RepID=A0ABX1DWZ8_9PROT|nr:amidohydrolase family protein [Falsiroseomonas selenitidurans]NKC29444.1 amidohydrolase family protein [Falsiroseomonas selenitidurans]